MNDNDKKQFTKEDDERFSPNIVIKKNRTSGDTNDNAPECSKEKSPLRLKIENFFYHYKWHSIAALFVVFVIIFCALQTCERTIYDSYILYAGGKTLRASAEKEGESDYRTVYDTLGRYVSDFNEDGNRNLSFIDIYLPSTQEIEELKANGIGDDYTLYALLNENDELFRQNMLIGDYYVCLISERLLTEWTRDEKNNPFKSIAEYLPAGAKIAATDADEGYLLASEYGVYLRSVPAGARPGLKDLPDDTVICIRKLSGIGNPKKSTVTKYEAAEQTLRLILADKAPD